MGETLHKGTTDFKELKLEDVLVVNFFNAIKNNDYKLLGENATERHLSYLLIEYENELKKINGTGIYQHKIDVLSERYFKVILLVRVLLVDIENEGIIDAIRVLHPNFNKKPTEKDIENILKENDKLYKRIENYKKNIKKENENKKFDIYKSIGYLSVNFKFKLNPKELTLKEYLTYINIAKENESQS